MINQYHDNNPRIANGIVTPKMYPLVVVVFELLVEFVLLTVLLIELEPLHGTHLDVDSSHVYVYALLE